MSEERKVKMGFESRIVNYKKEDPLARQVMLFFNEIDRIHQVVDYSPVKAATYRYAMEYLNFAFAESEMLKNLTAKSVLEDQDVLFGKYERFIEKYVPIMQGYNERKAAHLKSLESEKASKSVGINDI